LQVEVTGACNLRCRMCLVSYRPALNKRSGSFDLDTFVRLVDGNPQLEKVTLQGLGEPLLSPHLFAMVEHAVSRGVQVGFNTNATLLTPAVGERLVRAQTGRPSETCGSSRSGGVEGRGVPGVPRGADDGRPAGGRRGCALYRHTF
jgi:hypothetical protein